MASKEFWQEVIEKYSSYEGSVTKFCQEQSISKSQFYYHYNSAKMLEKFYK